jgi:hypothetical protein
METAKKIDILIARKNLREALFAGLITPADYTARMIALGDEHA